MQLVRNTGGDMQERNWHMRTTRTARLVILAITLSLTYGAALAESLQGVTHVKVFHEKGRFAGWPANHGIWSWGNEILVGFKVGLHKEVEGSTHSIDREKPVAQMLARSLDGGETWKYFDSGDFGLPKPSVWGPLPEPAPPCPGGIEFTHPDFAMTLRHYNNSTGPSHLYYSYDRGHHWTGPFLMPDFGTLGIAARTDYIVNGKHDCTVFLTASKSDGNEGRPLCVSTTDGGKTWELLSFIGPEPGRYAIMPTSVRLSETDLFTVIRCKENDRGAWLAAYKSEDLGRSWSEVDEPVSDTGAGNPASLIQLEDGRLCLTYGIRSEPFRICAKLSTDHGLSWSDEIVLRDDGGNKDLGYVQSVQRPDGKVVTTYYFNDEKSGPERYIAASIWEVPVNGG